MAEYTKISWADHTWNPWKGCHKVSPGCKNCYMFREYGKRYGNDANIVKRTTPQTWNKLSKFPPGFVFVCSWSDFWIKEADEWRDDAWNMIRDNPQHTYLIPTKRPERINGRLPDDWGNGWQNVWLGVSVEDHWQLERINILFKIPNSLYWVSYEPALEAVDFKHWIYNGMIDWLISGGESGPNYRPADLNWFRQCRDDCQTYNIPYFHKQHGGNHKISGEWGGYQLDSRTHHEFPPNQHNK